MNRNHHRTLITEQLLDAGNSEELPCSYDGGFLTHWGRVIEPFGTMTADGLTKLLDSIDRAYERDIPVSREEAWEAYGEYEEWDDGDRRPDPSDPDYPSYAGCVCPYGECDDGSMCDLRSTVHQAVWERAVQVSGLSLGRSKWWYRKMVTDGELYLGDLAHPPMSYKSYWYLSLGSSRDEEEDNSWVEDLRSTWWHPALLESTRQGYRHESILIEWEDYEAELREAETRQRELTIL
jgi:hypothetical protein